MTAARPPRGFVAAWSAIGAAALGVVVYQAVHPPGHAAVPGVAAPAPSAPGRSSPSAAAATATSGASSAPARAVPAADVHPGPAGSTRAPSGSHAPSGAPAPSQAPPSPSRPPSPPSGALYATAAVVVPVRSAPLVVRVAVVAPTVQPWPPTLAALVLAP